MLRRALATCFWMSCVALACQRTPNSGSRYVDLITAPDWVSRFQVEGPKKAFCGDQTHFSWVIMPGGELSASLEFGESRTLVLSGCTSAAAGSPREASGSLDVMIEAPGGRGLRESVPLGTSDSWWQHEIDLAVMAGETGRIRLVARFDAGQRLVLKDLALHQEVPLGPLVPDRPQALLISLDTFRADAISGLGGRYPTPALDRLIADSQVWLSHYSAAATTKPAHASLLTGHFGWVHGALQNDTPIRGEVKTLAERLRDGGFHTAGLVYDAVWLDPRFGFGRGFDAYRSVPWTLPQMVRALATWLTDHRGDPFFFFFHAFETHSDFNRLPYEAPSVDRDVIFEKFSLSDYGCRRDKCASEYLQSINDGLEPLPGEEEALRFLYGRSVTHLDAELGRLFEHLQELGIYDRMMIIVTADHGEALLEQGAVLHGVYWEEVIRVPLIIKWPGGRYAGEQISIPSSGIDVAPTILNAFGLPSADLPGAPLPARKVDAPIFVSSGWNAVISDGFKWVEVGEQGLLFEIGHDAGGHVGDQRPEQQALLKGLLAERIEADERELKRWSTTTPEPSPSFSAEERRRLRELGYLR